jgi:hypothetical protein
MISGGAGAFPVPYTSPVLGRPSEVGDVCGGGPLGRWLPERQRAR